MKTFIEETIVSKKLGTITCDMCGAKSNSHEWREGNFDYKTELSITEGEYHSDCGGYTKTKSLDLCPYCMSQIIEEITHKYNCKATIEEIVI